ncbi:ProQ/FINO family protein [Escherichia coli]|uniref:ProQ/FINO family protein n=1 Tax=Escherichia fergusonii TaxID=564 RepID=UPI0017EAE238|nr:hypothetical protein [Escherichia coli]EGK2819719.1 hypothetical protein [Escherichia coli]EHH4431828.1 hypothetical protein [Escherichia coli]EIT7655209.1 ProQ/FinO family protein [Escherichia coli]
MSLSESKKQRQKEAKALLEGFWPELFRFNKPRPLKMGVFADLVEDAKQRGLPFGEDIIRAAITIYTCRYAYQKSLSKVRERFNLSGEPEGEVTAEQKEYARLQIQRIDAKAKARKQARENENAAKPADSQSSA